MTIICETKINNTRPQYDKDSNNIYAAALLTFCIKEGSTWCQDKKAELEGLELLIYILKLKRFS